MRKSCEQCGLFFEGKSPAGRFCSSTCRSRKSRGMAAASALPSVATPATGVELSVRGQLEAAGRSETYLAGLALSLAQRMDASTAVMGFAALAKELRATMSEALVGAEVKADDVDELKARRDAKLAG